MEEIQKTEIHYVEKNSSIYPARLRELSGMPKQLYYIGRFPEDNKPTAAIVGARLCSAYGRIQAFRYGKFLSEHAYINFSLSEKSLFFYIRFSF